MTTGWTFVCLVLAVAGTGSGAAVSWFSDRADALRRGLALGLAGATCYIIPFLWNAGEGAFG